MKIKLSLLALFALNFLACNKDFKVGADYKDITVIYALLTNSDPVQYVKITKGFFDEKQDNLLLAQNPDSFFYSNIEVKLEELNNGNVVKTTLLPRVDLNLEGFPKDTGIFAQSPNYAYKIADSLNASKTYRIRVKNLTSGKEITGETVIIDSKKLFFRTPFINTDQLRFDLAFDNTNFVFSAPTTGTFFDISLRFWYQEINTQTLDTIYTHKDLPLVQNILSNGTSEIPAIMSNYDFYRALNSELGVAPSYINRRVDTPDLILSAGGQVLKTYIDANNAQGGITYDQIKPNFTNLIGEDALGIVSTRGKTTMYAIPFSSKTFDSIIGGSFTKNLNIVGKSTE